MKLLQFTDIHLTTPGQTIADRDPNANFERALNHALSHHSDAEAVVITGDLSDWGERDDYVRLKARLKTVPMPVHLCIGNHDDRSVLLSVFPELADENGHVQGIFPLSQGVGITIDTWGPETHAGHFCDVRARWLDKQLSCAEGPVYLFMHHNPVPMGIEPMDRIMQRDADLLARTLKPHAGKIQHLFHGHCHLPLSGSFCGIPFSAPRGTNHAGWPDFAATKVFSSSDLPESYAVAQLFKHGVMVHMVEYGYAGDIRSEGSPDYAQWDRLTMVR
ncbi:metallophosphoesterase [Yoonia sp. GPGPB17]|uniref:metallophosphoesterase n=1 Tax=Yoonia sp. GPGPB17 TaxID=3026147 RepID=UPI0030C2AA02